MKTPRFVKILTGLLIFFVPSLGLLGAETLFQISEEGLASWYGQEFAGRPTANGEIFDPSQLTAAHRTLPFGTEVTVTNLDNGRSINVRINDRGPFVDGRSIDVSRGAAEQLGMLGSGVVRVKIEALVKSIEALRSGTKVSTPSSSTSDVVQASLVINPGISPLSEGQALKTLQIASFSNQNNARKLVEYLQQNSLEAQIEETVNHYFRVVLKDIKGEKVAEVNEQLKSLGYVDILVRQQ